MTSIYFTPSIGLAAFAFLMWVTIPWAFLDKSVHPTTARLLALSEKLFFASGVFFVATIVSDLFAPLTPLVSNSDFILRLFFLSGTFAAVLGIFFTFLLIDRLVYGGSDIMSLADLAYVLIFVLMDAFYLSQIITDRTGALDHGILVLLYYISMFVGIAASVASMFLIRENRNEALLTIGLTVLPFILLILILSGVR